MPAPQLQTRLIIGSLRVALDLDGDKFQSFNHREELNSAVQLLNFRSVWWHTAHGAYYIYRRAIYIYPQDYVSLENTRSSAITTRQIRQHTAYKVFAGYTHKIYKCMYSTYSLNFKSQKGSIELLHLPHRLYHNYLITAKSYWGHNFYEMILVISLHT